MFLHVCKHVSALRTYFESTIVIKLLQHPVKFCCLNSALENLTNPAMWFILPPQYLFFQVQLLTQSNYNLYQAWN